MGRIVYRIEQHVAEVLNGVLDYKTTIVLNENIRYLR